MGRSVVNYRTETLQPRCDFCQEQLGPAEPVVWLKDGLARVTTTRAAPELATDRRRGAIYHRRCFALRPR
jgi:hypothetical protein